VCSDCPPGDAPRIAGPVQNYLRRAYTSVRFRTDRRLDKAAVARAHDVLYESDAWTQARWLGAQALKNPLDLWIYQEIVFDTRPGLIVETGTYRGGSALYLASLCDLVGSGEVVSIDVEPIREDYPHHPRITYLGGRSSTDPGVIGEVRERAAGRPILVILDSDHSQRHVEAELAVYAPLVPLGGYVIVEDSNIGQIRRDLVPGPFEAISTFLASTDEFEIDRSREKFLITFNPSGYLKRVREAS
jgi:cephalosporin hydroxylase